MDRNIDLKVVDDFGNNWEKRNQKELLENKKEFLDAANKYFSLIPLSDLKNANCFDMGCGSGRWSKFLAPKVKSLKLIDPSPKCIDQAKKNLFSLSNCEFEVGSVAENNLQDDFYDLGYSLGVLHHLPDTEQGIKQCVRKLKKGGLFLVYLYYNFENRPLYFRVIWKTSDYIRKLICRLPYKLKYFICNILAVQVYYPLAKISCLLEKFEINVENFPLSFYRNKSFYVMKTDCLDRFGTKLEKRFSKNEIRQMMTRAGLTDIKFAKDDVYWLAIRKREK